MAIVRRRDEFADFLATHRPEIDLDAARTVYGELTANAALHASGPVEVEVSIDERVALCVRDHGRGFDRGAASADPLCESGRGLTIVQCLADEVAIRAASGGGCEVVAILAPLRERGVKPSLYGEKLS